MQTIYTARDLPEAHIVAGMLQAEGIAAHVSGHFLQGAIGDMAALDFARVLVPEDQVAAALPLIAEYDGGREQAEPRLEPEPTSVAGIWWLAGFFLLAFVLIWGA